LVSGCADLTALAAR
nr:RecName: Full=Peroxidase 6 [Daucus carota]